jgi:ABC-type multidrug transport system ATPase subunit
MDKILSDEKLGVPSNGLRVVGVEKCYRKYPFGIESKDDVYAVRGIYLDVPRNELLCLLGHNGAGKSTLFNMLTGIIGPSEGYAKICNLDIRD